MAITIRDIAKRLNLSNTTISRVLNGKQGTFISDATRDKVLSAAREMGYQPNIAARALVTGQTRMVTLWINETHAPFYAKVLHCIQQQVWQHDYQLIISAFSGDTGVLLGGSYLPNWPTDGFLAVDLLRSIDAFMQIDPAQRPPIVTIGVYYLECFDYVGVELYPAKLQAARHLVAAGCKRIAYLGIKAEDWLYTPYTVAAKEAGMTPEFIFVPDGRRSSARFALHEHIRERGCPDGLFCNNDDAAIGAYRAMRDLGLKIPDDVAIVGCDGIEDTEYLDVPISTIVQPVEEMCALGWQFLEQRMKGPSIPLLQTILPAHFVVRESSQR